MKNLAKKLFSLFSLIVVLPCFLLYKLTSTFITRETSFQGMSQLLSLLPGLIGEYLRREFYRLTLQSCSNDCCISFGTIFSHPDSSIGKGVYIGAYCTLGKVSLGDYVLLGSNVDIISGKKQHNFSDLETPMKFQGGSYEKIYIGEDSWVGNSAVVMANIGKKCIAGAGSVVVSDIKDYSIAVGNPAKIIKKRIVMDETRTTY